MKKEENPKRVTKVFNLIKLSTTMKTILKTTLVVMMATILIGCQKIEQDNTDKGRTEQQGSKDTNNGNKTDKNDKGNKPDDQQRVKPNPTPSFATGWVPVKKNSKYAGNVPIRFDRAQETKMRLEGFPYDTKEMLYYTQLQQGSCTSFAVSIAISYQANFMRRHLSFKDESFFLSPSYLYNVLKGIGPCETAGSSIEASLQRICDKGIPRELEFRYDASTCSAIPDPKIDELAAYTRIKSFDPLQLSFDSFTGALSQGYPIIIGAYLNQKFFDLYREGGDYIYTKEDYDQGGEIVGSHAMTVIGFDQDEGSITLINSWGSGIGWKKTGYVKVHKSLIGSMIAAAYYVDNKNLYDYKPYDDAPNPPDPAPNDIRIATNTSHMIFTSDDGEVQKQRLTITNNGSSVVNISPYLEGKDKDYFRLERDTDIVIYPNSYATLEVIYSPNKKGIHTAILALIFSDRAQRVVLSGTTKDKDEDRKREDERRREEETRRREDERRREEETRRREDERRREEETRATYTIKEVPAAQDATIECPAQGLPTTYSGKRKIALRDLRVTEVGGNLRVTGRLMKEDTERFTQRGEVYIKYGEFCQNNKEIIGFYYSGDSSVDLDFYVSKAEINNKIYILTKSTENKNNRFFTNIIIELVRR